MDSMLSALEEARTTHKISQAAYTNISAWLTEEKYALYRADVEKLITDSAWKELEDRFFTIVPFGTGGRRGTVGVGSNRINHITMGESAQGLANYLLQNKGESAKQKGVVIAYDTRLTSEELAQYTASIFAGNGFKTYLFESFRATPELSFAVRFLKAAAGVVISASHNPPADNGFKAYWSDGGQIVAPHDAGIMAEVSQVSTITTTSYNDAVKRGDIVLIGEALDTAYTDAIVRESLSPSRSARIVYSPLHGTGSRSVSPVLAKAGFTDVIMVAEQATPDGNFPTIEKHLPNPEVPTTSNAAIAKATQESADIAITTDPDADRLGTAVRTSDGTYTLLNGNQIAALLGYYVLEQMKQKNLLTSKHFMAKTIVTTDLLTAMANDFGVKIYDHLLVGFKYVAELIQLKENQETFIFGGEESHGILKGDYTRDKDAAIAALLMAELTSTLKDQGHTLLWQLDELYTKYGVFVETLTSIFYEGAQGFEQMNTIMRNLRTKPLTTLEGRDVRAIIDRSTGMVINPTTKQSVSTIEGTKGDVIVLVLSDDGRTRVTIRPSGTEPKLKAYVQVHEPVADEDLEVVKARATAHATTLTTAITTYLKQV